MHFAGPTLVLFCNAKIKTRPFLALIRNSLQRFLAARGWTAIFARSTLPFFQKRLLRQQKLELARKKKRILFRKRAINVNSNFKNFF